MYGKDQVPAVAKMSIEEKDLTAEATVVLL